MVAVLSANNRAGRDTSAPAPALKADGSNYKWRMFYEYNSRIADADTLAEMLGVFIRGYEDLNEEHQLDARITHARGVQAQLRVSIIAGLDTEEDAKLTELQRVVINNTPFGEDPSGWGKPLETGGTFDLWTSDVPLILLDTSYEPFTDVKRPSSSYGDVGNVPNIGLLRPSEEMAYLLSLNSIGLITFGTPAPAPVGTERRVR